MANILDTYLTAGTFLCGGSTTWGNGSMPLKVDSYLNTKQPPGKYVSSVRAIVFKEDSVLVVIQEDGPNYILPGGRGEANESPVDTVNREVLEETGWTMGKIDLFALMHYHHLNPRPADYRYPYPDFLWPIYLAEASEFFPEAIQPDDYVSESFFLPVSEVQKLPLREAELLMLKAALRQLKINNSPVTNRGVYKGT